MVLFLYFKNGWEGMTFSTTNMRVETGTPCFFAKRCYLYSTLEPGCQRTTHLSAQLHELAGVRPVDRRNRASSAKVAGPGGSQQTTFFMVAAPVVIAVKVFTLCSSRGFHFAAIELPQVRSAGELDYTRVRYSPVRVSTRMVSPTFTKFGHCTSKPVSTFTFLVTPVAVSPRTATSA